MTQPIEPIRDRPIDRPIELSIGQPRIRVSRPPLIHPIIHRICRRNSGLLALAIGLNIGLIAGLQGHLIPSRVNSILGT